MRRLTSISILSVLAFVVPLSPARASACVVKERDPGEQAQMADQIFQGTASGSRPVRRGRFDEVTFVVERTWKGDSPSVLTVLVPTGRCTIQLTTGRRYTVFARQLGDGFWTDARMGTVAGSISPSRYGLVVPQEPEPLTPSDPMVETPDWFWLVPVLFVVLAVGGAVLNWWLKQKRRKEIAFFGHQLGLAYSQHDPGVGMGGHPFELFHKGDGRGYENFLTGTWQGVELAACDYWYYEETRDSNGRRHRTYYRFSCLTVPVDAACPALRIHPEGLFSRLADRLGFSDIRFELEEFNRAFEVESDDRRFASAFVDQRMMQQLLRAGNDWGYEVAGSRALVYHDRLAPAELVHLLGTAKGFADHIPRVIASLYARPSQG